jgi:glucose/arabinose dehydrogenase
VKRLLPVLVAGIAALPIGGCAGDDAALIAPVRGSRSALKLRVVVSGLAHPVHVAAPAGERGRLYVVEQAGRIRIVERGRIRAEPFLDIRNLVGRSVTEQGLFSIAFHPRYASNHRFYVDYTDTRGDTRVVEYRSDGVRALPDTRRQLLFVDQPFSNHNGGQLAFAPDGRLWVAMGDGGGASDPYNNAQNPSSLLGKLLALDVDATDATPRVVALGLRNPWRFSFDRRTHDLYLGDVGASEWEEVDYVPHKSLRRVENFGWDVYEGRASHERKRRNPTGRLVRPVAVYPHSIGCSVTGGFVYRGSAVPSARGRYFYGDFCTRRIWSLRIVHGHVRDLGREPFRIESLSSFGEDARGELYVVSRKGVIYRLVR